MAFFLIRKFKIDASYVKNPLYCLIRDHTCTTIFLGTDPPNLPMMLSNSSKLILPSMSLSAYASVLMVAIFYSRGVYPSLTHLLTTLCSCSSFKLLPTIICST